MGYARSENGVVVHVLRVEPSTIWPAERAALYREAPEGVDVGWLDDGEAFTAPPPAPPVVPQAITMRQARLVLLGAGKLSLVEPAIAAIPNEATRKAAEIEWEFSNELQRGNAFVQLLAPALGLSSDQVDALFIAGAVL